MFFAYRGMLPVRTRGFISFPQEVTPSLEVLGGGRFMFFPALPWKGRWFQSPGAALERYAESRGNGCCELHVLAQITRARPARSET